MGNKTDILWLAIAEMMEGKGIRSKAASMILYAMATEVLSYDEARDIYADWAEDAPERVQSSVCFALLRAGYEIPPAQLLGKFLEELKK